MHTNVTCECTFRLKNHIPNYLCKRDWPFSLCSFKRESKFSFTIGLFQQAGGLKPDGAQAVVGNGLQALKLQPGGVLTPILPPTAHSGAPTFLPVTVSGVSATEFLSWSICLQKIVK